MTGFRGKDAKPCSTIRCRGGGKRKTVTHGGRKSTGCCGKGMGKCYYFDRGNAGQTVTKREGNA